jgi:hypothetical protein
VLQHQARQVGGGRGRGGGGGRPRGDEPDGAGQALQRAV